MKKKVYTFLSIILINFLISSVYSSNFANLNSLNNVEVYANDFASQITFEFANPLYFETSVDTDNSTLELAFLCMNLKDFKNSGLLSKIKKNKKMGLFIKEATVTKKETPCSRVILNIKFATPDVLVKWCKFEESLNKNKLILDIFLKNKLADIEKNDSVVLYANNESIKNDSIAAIKSNLKIYKEKPRIVIDAGHGGSDTGAKGYYSLVEKNLTLDIACRAKKLLKKAGFKVALTRNSDEEVSLEQRSELAGQLKADLMVSIHCNAAYNNNAFGLESFYIDRDALLRSASGYWFANSGSDLQSVKNADKFLMKNCYKSKVLASNVHNGVLDFLQRNNQNTKDRGIKPAPYRVLLHSQMPVTLIEVGFLTNEQEAKKLKQSSYRQVLAEGICNGIKSYLFVN